MGEEPATRELEAILGHQFRSPALLLRALTHRSLARQIEHAAAEDSAVIGVHSPATGSPVEDNERLEFLGDAVLNLVVAETLFHLHPEWQEGELTRVRAQLVSRQNMAQVAESIGLGEYLRVSRGEERSGLRHKSTVLSDSMEAVMGALFLDGGLETVRAFSRTHVTGDAVEQLAEELRSGAALGNYKSALQERLQAARVGTPVYRVKSESGPPHRRRFTVEVVIKSESGVSESGVRESGVGAEPLARGAGSTKKRAEQDAARRALEHLAAAELTASQPSGENAAAEVANLRFTAALESDEGESAAQ